MIEHTTGGTIEHVHVYTRHYRHNSKSSDDAKHLNFVNLIKIFERVKLQ